MRKPISPAAHSAIDYPTTAAIAAAPRLFDFPPAARRACDVLAGGYAPFAALTRTPLGLKPTIPLKTHRNLDVALGFAIPALPWLLGFARHRAARNFFLGLTAITIVATLFTDWERDTVAA
jgi:hypothetical protein